MCFEDLIKKFSLKLKRITYKLNGHFAFFNHEDLYQEALLHLWLDFKQGKLTDKTDSYILQGCYFHLKNYLRKNKRKAILVSFDEVIHNEKGEELNLNMLLSLKNSDSTLNDIHAKILLEQINNNGLTEREKEIFNLTLEGLTSRSIGRKLGISHVRVVKLQKRIRGKCKKHLDLF